ncbi:MAG: hypothetical protein RJA57_1131 [Bacteroidota bacterium]
MWFGIKIFPFYWGLGPGLIPKLYFPHLLISTGLRGKRGYLYLSGTCDDLPVGRFFVPAR